MCWCGHFFSLTPLPPAFPLPFLLFHFLYPFLTLTWHTDNYFPLSIPHPPHFHAKLWHSRLAGLLFSTASYSCCFTYWFCLLLLLNSKIINSPLWVVIIPAVTFVVVQCSHSFSTSSYSLNFLFNSAIYWMQLLLWLLFKECCEDVTTTSLVWPSQSDHPSSSLWSWQGGIVAHCKEENKEPMLCYWMCCYCSVFANLIILCQLLLFWGIFSPMSVFSFLSVWQLNLSYSFLTSTSILLHSKSSL